MSVPIPQFCLILRISELNLMEISTFLSESESHSVMLDSLRPHGFYSPSNSPGQNTGTGSLSLLQGIFPTQGSNPGLPHCRQILYHLSHKGSLILRVAVMFDDNHCLSLKFLTI